jgi:hypothetical protein
MNVDEAIKVAKRQVLGWYDDMHIAGPVLAAEVERLRAEVAAAYAAGQKAEREAMVKHEHVSPCPTRV